MVEKMIISEGVILDRIYIIRGHKVMIDADLAFLYGVGTRDLNKAVQRNLKRFPDDFMFQVTNEEFKNLMFQFGTSRWGGRRKLPKAFTEQGVAMLSSILNSDRAIMVNIQIIRVFTKMRQLIESQKEILAKIEQLQSKEIEHDQQILLIFEYLKELDKTRKQEMDFNERRRIGFIHEE